MSTSGKKAPHLLVGEKGEKLAVRYLRLRGYRIIRRNHRCRLGEIDIIAKKGKTLVFIEVRSRSEPWLTGPASTVDDVKIVRTINAARHYLMETNLIEVPCRFDVLGISFPWNSRPAIEHIQGAFDLSSDLADDAARIGARRLADLLRRSFPLKKRESRDSE